jgi:hypothetical protein
MSQNIIVEPSDLHAEEQEAQEAQTSTPEAAEVVIPEKYQGKTFDDVVKMHQNLEKEYGRQANEVGTYRELVSSLADTKRSADLSPTDTTETPVEVTSDDIFDNPSEAIQKVVQSVLEKELAPLRQSQTQTAQQNALAQLHQEYPDIEQIGADPQFTEYVAASEYRLADAQRWLETQDIDAARRLVKDFKDSKGSAAPAPREQKVEVTESGRGGSGAESGKKLYYRDQITRMIAKDPEKYRSKAFQDELKKAIAEGRFRE